MSVQYRLPRAIIIGAAFLVVTGCEKAEEKKRPAPQVGFIVVRPEAVPLTVSLGGRTIAYESSEVRPQVNGIIRARLFVEGGDVRQGQPLFQIDASLYRAAVNQASANLEAARASAEAASARAQRYRPLAAIEAVSRQEYTDALAQARQSRAAIAQQQAALETARINLRYATVPAPISGRIGRSLFTTGALVSASQNDPLAVIQRLDPIYVDMQQSSAELVALRRALARGGTAPGSALVRLKLEDGSDYPHPGNLQFSEMTVNEATGTVTLRARFPNPDGLLLPGMFVQASFDQAVQQGAFLVPEPALQREAGGDAAVFVVGKDNKVERRVVTTARSVASSWVVTAGLRPGERIVTQGAANIKPGMEVRPVPASSPEKIAPPGAAPGAGGKGG